MGERPSPQLEEEAINASRKAFADRLKSERVDVHDVARETNELIDKHPEEDPKAIHKSGPITTQVIETVKVKDLLGSDDLTGAYSLGEYKKRMGFLQDEERKKKERLESETSRRTDLRDDLAAFSMIALDIDKFKVINDTHGHHAGDAVLKEFAGRIQKRLRKGDFLARCGGEEFRVVVMKANGYAPKVAEELRRLIEQKPITINEGTKEEQQIPVTVSVGVSPYDEKTGIMEEHADKALYAAKGNDRSKEEQRNQVWVWDPMTEQPLKYEELSLAGVA